MELREYLKKKRVEKQLSQKEIDLLIKSNGTYQKYELGKREPISKSFIKICEILSIDLGDLEFMKGDKNE